MKTLDLVRTIYQALEEHALFCREIDRFRYIDETTEKTLCRIINEWATLNNESARRRSDSARYRGHYTHNVTKLRAV